MGVFIYNMELPKSCADCPICYDQMECPISDLRFWRGRPENKEFKFTEERHPRCQLTDENEMRIYGYPVRALAEIAYTMREKGVSEYEAIDILKNTDEVAKIITDAQEKMFHETIRSFTKPMNPEIEDELNEGWKKILEALEVDDG